MNSFVVGIDLGEKESFATYIAPDGDISEPFSLCSQEYTEQYWISMPSKLIRRTNNEATVQCKGVQGIYEDHGHRAGIHTEAYITGQW